MVIASVVMLATFAAAQEGTWSTVVWSDPVSGAELPAIATPSEFGLDGRALLACEAEGPGGLTMVIESPELADMPDDVLTVGYRMDMDEMVGHEPGSWARQGDGSIVRYVGPDDVFATMMEGMTNSISPAFVVVVGEFVEENMKVMVLESQGLGGALGALPCSAAGA